MTESYGGGASSAVSGARPQIVMGTGGLIGSDGQWTIRTAYETGYRVFDTAYSYGNERDVGKALKNADDAFVITKLPGRAHGARATAASVREQLDALGRDAIDLYLIHWPLPRLNLFVESWEEMLRAREAGLIKDVGVSNFTAAMIEKLGIATGVMPSVIQVECHPWWPQDELVDYCANSGVAVMAWSPLRKTQGHILQAPEVVQVAERLGCPPAEAILRWHRARGVVPVVKSRDPDHLAANLFSVAGTPDQLDDFAEIARIQTRARRGGDPDEHEEF